MNQEYLAKRNQKHLKEINHANNRTNGQYKKQVEELETLIKTDPVQEWLDDINSIQKNSNSLEEKMKEQGIKKITSEEIFKNYGIQ